MSSGKKGKHTKLVDKTCLVKHSRPEMLTKDNIPSVVKAVLGVIALHICLLPLPNSHCQYPSIRSLTPSLKVDTIPPETIILI